MDRFRVVGFAHEFMTLVVQIFTTLPYGHPGVKLLRATLEKLDEKKSLESNLRLLRLILHEDKRQHFVAEGMEFHDSFKFVQVLLDESFDQEREYLYNNCEYQEFSCREICVMASYAIAMITHSVEMYELGVEEGIKNAHGAKENEGENVLVDHSDASVLECTDWFGHHAISDEASHPSKEEPEDNPKPFVFLGTPKLRRSARLQNRNKS